MPAAPRCWWTASSPPALGNDGAVRRDLPLDPDAILRRPPGPAGAGRKGRRRRGVRRPGPFARVRGSCSMSLFDRVIQTSGNSAPGHHALALPRFRQRKRPRSRSLYRRPAPDHSSIETGYRCCARAMLFGKSASHGHTLAFRAPGPRGRRRSSASAIWVERSRRIAASARRLRAECCRRIPTPAAAIRGFAPRSAATFQRPVAAITDVHGLDVHIAGRRSRRRPFGRSSTIVSLCRPAWQAARWSLPTGHAGTARAARHPARTRQAQPGRRGKPVAVYQTRIGIQFESALHLIGRPRRSGGAKSKLPKPIMPSARNWTCRRAVTDPLRPLGGMPKIGGERTSRGGGGAAVDAAVRVQAGMGDQHGGGLFRSERGRVAQRPGCHCMHHRLADGRERQRTERRGTGGGIGIEAELGQITDQVVELGRLARCSVSASRRD